MSLVTTLSSQQALGISKLSDGHIARTKQSMSNAAGRKDIVSLPSSKSDHSSFTNPYLCSVDNAEGLKFFLHHYGYKVLVITHTMLKKKKMMDWPDFLTGIMVTMVLIKYLRSNVYSAK